MSAKRLKWSYGGMDARGTGVEYVRASEYDTACKERDALRVELAETQRENERLRKAVDKATKKPRTFQEAP